MDEKGIIAAIDEERISRKKRDGNFPILAFEAALSKGDLSAEEITDCLLYTSPSPRDS